MLAFWSESSCITVSPARSESMMSGMPCAPIRAAGKSLSGRVGCTRRSTRQTRCGQSVHRLASPGLKHAASRDKARGIYAGKREGGLKCRIEVGLSALRGSRYVAYDWGHDILTLKDCDA